MDLVNLFLSLKKLNLLFVNDFSLPKFSVHHDMMTPLAVCWLLVVLGAQATAVAPHVRRCSAPSMIFGKFKSFPPRVASEAEDLQPGTATQPPSQVDPNCEMQNA